MPISANVKHLILISDFVPMCPRKPLKERHVFKRKNVLSVEAEYQEHLRRPASNASQFLELPCDFVIIQQVKRLQHQFFPLHSLGKGEDVFGLGSRGSNATDLLLREVRYCQRGYSTTTQFFQSAINSCSSLDGKHLLNDFMNEKCVSSRWRIRSICQRSNQTDNPRQFGVGIGEMDDLG